jgi:cytosine/adenosine deaminase-related metal-dependent hydrolase
MPELLRMSAKEARHKRWPLTMHVAESAEEFAMFTRAQGAMYDWLERSGRDMSDCGLGSPVQHLARNGMLSERLLAVHVNYLAKNDAALLARRRVHVAHCPRSHAFFKHAPFPLKRLRRAGVNVCLGTDSLASVYKPRRQSVELSLFSEMQTLAESAPWLPKRNLVEMATVNGARALGLAGKLGQLSRGAFADLIALPFAGRVAEVHDAVVQHAGPVSASMIAGQWVLPAAGLAARDE